MIVKIVFHSGSIYAFEDVSNVDKQREKITLTLGNGKQIDIDFFEVSRYTVWLNNGKEIMKG